MAFCGNCGLQLPSHASACPRCGTATDPRLAMDDSHPNDPTIAVHPVTGEHLPTIQATPAPPSSTQPTYISQPGVTPPGTISTGGQSDAPTYITPLPPVASQGNNPSPYRSGRPGYPPPPSSGVNYEPTAISGTNYPASGTSSPDYPPPGGVVYQPIGAAYAPAPRQRQSRSGIVALILFLVALLFVGGALGIFFAKREGLLFGSPTPTPAPVSTQAVTSTQTTTATQTPTSAPTYTPTPTSIPITQQAQTLLQNYYSDINNKDYQDAYAMLGSQMQAAQGSYTSYANGYASTQQDNLTITNTTQNSDGTVRLDVTLTATLTDGSTQNYTGYYIIGPQNGSLKILSGKLQQSS
ncbi:MAG TPA: hypothetical protein VKV40_25265 [Ktedonobacteraceae bacterium]|nr:hypothetical protein [Ktedonobacteraceae bacterium]